MRPQSVSLAPLAPAWQAATAAWIEDASLFFSVVVAVLAWAGLYLREERLRALLPFKRDE